MANITLSIPDGLMEKMKEFKEIKWSEIARQAIQQRIEDLEIMNKITKKSKISDKDIRELSEKIKKGVAKKHGLI